MAFLLVVATIAVTLGSVVSALPPCVCTRNLKPVCGSDGQTYANKCLLECEITKGRSVTLLREGPCDMPAQPQCFCPFNSAPVCGTDGKTYGNKCEIQCEQGKVSDLEVAYEGECKKLSGLTDCICGYSYRPVCGSNGVEYSNKCYFECAQKSLPELTIKQDSRCQGSEQLLVMPICTCNKNTEFMCGSDGLTYNNKCLLECQQTVNKSLKLAYEGQCDPVQAVTV